MYPQIFNLLGGAWGLGDAAWFGDNWGWIVTGAIVFVGLGLIGFSDTRRFSLSRAWAISGVCFDESIRKRVLWITPLALIGVIGITQFQRAMDEQDAVRQSVKICLFATALVAVLTSIILACTNLPKEIESRVIYTILTKPTTRLELILGKVMGFARVSMAMVLIMGVFTWVYMRITSEQKRQQIEYRLREGDIGDTERARLSEYAHTGLLTARSLAPAFALNIYGQPPDPSSPKRVISNEGDEDMVAAFLVNRGIVFGPPQEDLEDWAHEGAGSFGMVIRVALDTQLLPGYTETERNVSRVMGPTPEAENSGKLVQPSITIQLLDEDYFDLQQGTVMVGASSADELRDRIIAYEKAGKIDPMASAALAQLSDPVKLPDGKTAQTAYAWLPPNLAIQLFNHPRFLVRVTGASNHVNYIAGDKPVSCFVPQIKPKVFDIDSGGATEITAFTEAGGTRETLNFRGKLGVHFDQEMSGGADAPDEMAEFTFANAPPTQLVDGQIPFQLMAQVDRSNSDIESGREDATRVDVTVIDDATKKITRLPQPVFIESRLPTFFSIPADSVTTGNFRLLFHCENSEQTIGLFPNSLLLVASHEIFELNLLKSLSIIWMMTILVIVLAVFSSTFLSWPIAVVLTVLLLLGHWGVEQVADSAGPGLGRQIVNDFKFTDAAISKVFSTSVDSLTHGLKVLSNVLPDTSQFDAIEDIEQGMSISGDKILGALTVLGGFGVSAVVLAYVILREKEVAP